MRHQLARDGRVWRCASCLATWTRSPRSRCPRGGRRLYRAPGAVPPELATRTSLRRRGLRLPPSARSVAVFESRHHRRYDLFLVAEALPIRMPSSLQLAALERARRTIGTCPRCRVQVGRAALVRRRHFLGVCRADEVHFDRLCRACYGAIWAEQEGKVIAQHRERYRGLLPRLAVLDFETTGLVDPAVVEVAVWGSAGLLFHSLVDPGPSAVWEPTAMLVHGLKPDDVSGAAAWPAVAAELAEVLRREGVTHLGSWGSYDREVVRVEGRRHGLEEVWPVTWLDLMNILDLEVSRTAPVFWQRGQQLPSIPRTSLARACRRFGVPAGNHRAIADAQAAYLVFMAMSAE